LRERAAKFLTGPIPAELKPHHVPGSLAERIMAVCARGQALDPELQEIAGLAMDEYDDAIEGAQTDELKAYYAESQALLADILTANEN
jgi:hypothetical protein